MRTKPRSLNNDSGQITPTNPLDVRGVIATSSNLGDPAFDISAGNITGISSINKFGRNTDIDTTTEDIWDGGGTYTWASSAVITHLKALVDSAATRNKTVEIDGLDANYALVTQTVTTDAADSTTEVAMGTALIRCFRMKNTSATSFDQIVAAGPTGFATTYAQISIGYNQTLMALYTIPAGKTGYLTNFWGDINKANTSGALDLTLWARSFGEVFRVQNTTGLIAAGGSHFQHSYNPYPSYSEKTDLRMSGIGSTNNFDVSAGFDLILADD